MKINFELYNNVKDLFEKNWFCDGRFDEFEKHINIILKTNDFESRINYNEIYASKCLVKNLEKKNEKENIIEKKEESNRKDENFKKLNFYKEVVFHN